MISSIISRLVILVFGTLYPAYASYKAVRTKNLKEYVKWMMYWIVFALFTCTETFTDVFLSWFPFYYEVKIVLVLWLLSPATKGSSILYRKFVHPALCRREQEIDEYIAKAKDQGYHTVLNLGTKGVNYATTVIMQTAIKGGGGLVQQLRKSYSLSDLSECEPREERGTDEADDVLTEPRLIRRATAKSGYNTRRSASESNSRSPMYFPEVDVEVRGPRTAKAEEPDFSHIKSSEDISSGYSSADNSASLTRTGSLSAASRAKLRSRTTVTTIKRPQAAEDEVIIEELHDDDTLEFSNMPPLVNLPQNLYLSNSDPPFIYQLVGDQVRIIQVLGNNSNTFNHENNNPDRWDQKETYEDASPMTDSKENEQNIEHELVEKLDNNNGIKSLLNENTEDDIEKLVVETVNDHISDNIECKNYNTDDSNVANDCECKIDKLEKTNVTDQPVQLDFSTQQKEASKLVRENLVNDPVDTTSLDTSVNDNDTAESDDEASFGTPEDSPKSKRKSPKGKYGKGKAPPPPLTQESSEFFNVIDALDNTKISAQESLEEIVNRLPNNAFKETGSCKGLQVVNPIAEKKRRNKSKSPGRIPKRSSSGLGKLLQIPGKLAFWSKNDDKTKDNNSTSSGDRSRRSSTIEKIVDEFQSCNDLDEIIVANKEVADDQLSYKDAEFDNEAISKDIIDKSDELQKLIKATIDSHPEYKFVSLHEDTPTTSKTTDV